MGLFYQLKYWKIKNKRSSAAQNDAQKKYNNFTGWIENLQMEEITFDADSGIISVTTNITPHGPVESWTTAFLKEG